MLNELCPSKYRLEIAPTPVSISQTRQEFRVLESTNPALREATKIYLDYQLTSQELTEFLDAFNSSLGAYLSWELTASLKSIIGIPPRLYEFEKFWRFQNEALEIEVDDLAGTFTFSIYIVNVAK